MSDATQPTTAALAADHRVSWWREPWLWGAIVVGLLLRLGPLLVWPQVECIRDECIYTSIATGIERGLGLQTSNKGWLPAPGYPYTLAWARTWFGTYYSLKSAQVALGTLTIPLMYAVARRVEARPVALVSAWLFAINPTIAWFTNTLWIETFYIALLLLTTWGVLWAREGRAPRALLAGAALGVAILYRGVATYLPPFFILALLWPDEGFTTLNRLLVAARARFAHAALMVAALLAVVAPWSIHASQRYGGFIVSDATSGHVLYLGNNDYPPLTFDYGNGMLTQPIFSRYLASGRPQCSKRMRVAERNQCEVDAAKAFIANNPREFVRRIPLRLAQQANPHSFLTRHVRWGLFPAIPFVMKEFLITWIMVQSIALMVLGAVGAAARARGPFGWMSLGVIGWTTLVTCVMYGMTRFRLPCEPFLGLYLAWVLVHPRATLQLLSASTPRAAALVVGLPPLLAAIWWFLPTGYPMFW